MTLSVVFADFTEDVSANVQSAGLLLCLVGLNKADKPNTTQYYVYDYQGNRVRSAIESDHQVQSQRDYLPSLDISK
jgi:hypothetical protein